MSTGKLVVKGILDPQDALEAVRCGADAIVDAGFAATPASVPAAAAVWLATDPDADRYLGRVVDGPKLMATLEETV